MSAIGPLLLHYHYFRLSRGRNSFQPRPAARVRANKPRAYRPGSAPCPAKPPPPAWIWPAVVSLPPVVVVGLAVVGVLVVGETVVGVLVVGDTVVVVVGSVVVVVGSVVVVVGSVVVVVG